MHGYACRYGCLVFLFNLIALLLTTVRSLRKPLADIAKVHASVKLIERLESVAVLLTFMFTVGLGFRHIVVRMSL